MTPDEDEGREVSERELATIVPSASRATRHRVYCRYATKGVDGAVPLDVGPGKRITPGRFLADLGAPEPVDRLEVAFAEASEQIAEPRRVVRATRVRTRRRGPRHRAACRRPGSSDRCLPPALRGPGRLPRALGACDGDGDGSALATHSRQLDEHAGPGLPPRRDVARRARRGSPVAGLGRWRTCTTSSSSTPASSRSSSR